MAPAPMAEPITEPIPIVPSVGTPVTSPGRHRLGTPGLIHVVGMVQVFRRGFFAALFRPGKHRLRIQAQVTGPIPAAVTA